MKTLKHYLYKKLMPTALLLAAVAGCYPEDDLNVDKQPVDVELSELDQYIQDNFTEPYDMAIRYRYVDRFVSPTERVAPPRLDVVRPMLDFIEFFWVEPFNAVPGGREFFKNHVPPEIVLLGGLIYNSNGTVILGRAENGARITFTDVNSIDPADLSWRDQQLQTVYHEFAHTVHQRYKLPPAFEEISPEGYSSAGAWFNVSNQEALQRGFVSPYATSSPNEDFAETVALLTFDPDFANVYIQDEEDCETEDCLSRNEGRAKIRDKVNAIAGHYEQVTGVDLFELRAEVQSRLQ